MQVILDRRKCSYPQVHCDVCFADHLAREDFDSADCKVMVHDDGRPETLFKVYDRDESIKTLVVKDENLGRAYESWLHLWEEQAGVVI